MSTVRSWLVSHGLILPHDLPNSSAQFRVRCPECGNDKDKCYVSALGKGASCKHCGLGKSWRGFQRLFEPPTPQEIALESFVKKTQESLGNLREYLNDRGIDDAVIDTLRFGYCDPDVLGAPTDIDHQVKLAEDGKWILAHRLTIPYITDGNIIKVRGRETPDHPSKIKYLDATGAEILPYIPAAVNHERPVILAEGELDAVMLMQHGYDTIAIPGANSFRKEWIRDYPNLYLALDGDETGRKSIKKLINDLEEVRKIELPEEMDVTDYIQTFGPESFAQLVDRATLYVFGKPQRDDRLKHTVSDWSEWAFTNGELLGPRIQWAPRLEKAISGWSRGVFLLGALPNSGKSCFLVQSAYECAKDNPDDTVAVYLSLDDDIEDAITRLVSCKTQVDFEKVRSPRHFLDNEQDSTKQHPEVMEQWFQALEELKSMDNLIVRDAKFGRSLDYLRNYFRSLRGRYGDKHIVVFIDSLAKITSEQDAVDTTNKTAWKAFLATELKYLSTIYNLCIVTPADFRKLNEGRRPTNDDIKDASELAYEANCIMLGFNEVNVQGKDDAVLVWEHRGEQYPLFEINISKNKKTKYRGNIRFKFFPSTCSFAEQSTDEDADIDQLIKMKAEEKKQQRG